jgi:excisionase family DNA binding protein
VKPDGMVYAHHGESLLLTVEEAAALLRIGRSRMYELITAGTVMWVRIGGAAASRARRSRPTCAASLPMGAGRCLTWKRPGPLRRTRPATTTHHP